MTLIERVTQAIQLSMDKEGFEIHEPAKVAVREVLDWLESRMQYGEDVNSFLFRAREEALGEENK